MKQIIKNIYHVGDNECSVYMVDTQSDQGLVLIDAGMNLNMIKRISSLGLRFEDIQHCILTHCHIDHIGACAELKRALPDIKFYAHELDATPIEEPDHDGRTAASWYGVTYEPIKLYRKFESDTTLTLGNCDFQCIHTPGHTPGSISVLVESEGKKVLFGQDLHGPFNDGFLSNLQDYQLSMQKLLDLKADILCEGHFGIFQPADKVKQYIETHKFQNQP
ncbi:MBL fold metallo-hydrolase [Desulfobacter postgatei]|uniref:MBL fold metallo-hydrolase n=1 Tax=Desulfobacter postgatei TaxID=2293 RepID=UPI00259B427E|nr:MBL fold metallo-hydrolase [uncultured Desulfobacter sp.]